MFKLSKLKKINNSIFRRYFSLDLIQSKIFSGLNKGHILSDELFHDRQLRYQAVIFDKDGTLICFHSMWTPWLTKLVKNINIEVSKDLRSSIFSILGVCSKTLRTQPGIMAEGTKDEIKAALKTVIISECRMSEHEAESIIEKHFVNNASNESSLRELHDIRKLFKIIKQHGIKIGICTSDTRESTLSTLSLIKAQYLVDCICCGDDPYCKPKPNSHNSLIFSKEFGLPVSEMVMVGDTQTDMDFAKNSGMGGQIGVLSGIADSNLLSKAGSSEIIQSVEDILPILLPHSPIRLNKESEIISSKKWKLIIMDKDGTLTDVHEKYKKWALLLGDRLRTLTSDNLVQLFYNIIGLENRVTFTSGSILGESAVLKMYDILKYLLILQGYSSKEKDIILEKVWVDTSIFADEEHSGFKETLLELKSKGIKLALNSSDFRSSVNNFIKRNIIDDVFDKVLSAEDASPNYKPLPDSILKICLDLEVSPSETLVVGDSQTDMLCARSANVGASIGVLSGIGKPQNLMGFCHLLLPNINYLPQLLQNRSIKLDNRRLLSYSNTNSNSHKAYDYIIIGAGSAGCVLANRLSTDPNNNVLLIEAGPSDNTWKIDMPAALMYNLCDDKYNWFYHTVPQKNMGNRIMYWPRGRVLGGSSSLNAMVYVRGHGLDYDRWEKEGADGWSYEHCLPYFRKSQSHELGENEYRGGNGPLHVTRTKINHPLHEAWIEAGREAGYGVTDDMNGFKQEGFGLMDMTIYKGERWSSSKAYLNPVLKRKNLKVITKTLTSKILFDGVKAIGVEILSGKNSKDNIMANKEVILSSGAINSPHLLMLSGVGDSGNLKKHGINVIAHLPGVGANLQDHLEVYVQYACKEPITLYSAQWKFPHNMIRIGLQWFLTKSGWGATSHLESGAFIRSISGVPHPDIQYHFLPSTVVDHGRKMGPCHAYQAHAGTMRSMSKGHIELRSNNPRDYPIIDPNYLSCEQDFVEFRNAVKFAREIFAQQSFDRFRKYELLPGNLCQSDKDIDEFIKKYSDSAYHPSCTCKMGSPNASDTVVDPSCKVIGVDNLRVVDASIMPSIISGNLNAPTIMIAEKASDIILGINPLAKSKNVPVWNPTHPEKQRDFSKSK